MSDPNFQNALHQFPDVDAVRDIISRNDLRRATDDHGMTLGMHAANQGHVPLLRLFYEEFEFDLRDTDAFGLAPIHHATQNGRVEAIRVLSELGADLNYNIDDEEGGPTPMCIAADKNDVATIRALAEGAEGSEGADLNKADLFGVHPIVSIHMSFNNHCGRQKC